MASAFTRTATFAAVALFAGVGLAACGANDANTNDETGGGKTIALLLPESETTRYESFDRPLFEAKVKELCSDCTVNYYNADKDTTKQAQQMDTAITEGASVIVLDPVDGKAIGSAVSDATAQGVKVVAYDRFIAEADYYISFDNEKVGALQAQALVDAMSDKGKIVMLNGDPKDPNAAQFKAGAHSVIDGSGLQVIAEFDNPDWSAENAQKFTNDQVNRFGADAIAGVYAANDQQAGGAIAALTGAGVKSDALPPVTGQDAELAAIQRIVAGEQAMTIYKPYKPEAEGAAEIAVALVNGADVSGMTDFQGVSSKILDPVVINVENVSQLVDDGFYTVDQICTSEYADACTAAGLM